MADQLIPFGEWLPDQPALTNPGALKAQNVIPAAVSYRSFPQSVQFSTSLSAKCVGAISVRDQAGNAYNYVGEPTQLRVLNGNSWSAVTRLSSTAYTTGADDFWEFVQWNQTIIGVNGLTDRPQRISLGAANFANLSGIAMPTAKHIAVVREFVVLGNVSDSALGVTRVRWSQFNNPFGTWSADPATLADYQDLPTEGGWVQRIVGGDTYGVIFQERAITTMNFVGSPAVFRFDPASREVGAYAPRSVVGYENLIFFLSESGFYVFDGVNLRPIGQDKVDKTFFKQLLTGTQNQVIGAIDTVNRIVCWAYTSTDGMTGIADRLIIYNWVKDKWSEVTGQSIEFIWRAITGGYTMDGLDALSGNLDLLTTTLDSRFYTGNQFQLAATDSSHRLGLFNGSALPATIQTGEFQPFMQTNELAFMSAVTPLIEGNSAEFTVVVTSRNSIVQSGSAKAAVASIGTTFAPLRVNAAYHRVEVHTSADFTHALGVMINPQPAGKRRGQ